MSKELFITKQVDDCIKEFVRDPKCEVTRPDVYVALDEPNIFRKELAKRHPDIVERLDAFAASQGVSLYKYEE